MSDQGATDSRTYSTLVPQGSTPSVGTLSPDEIARLTAEADRRTPLTPFDREDDRNGQPTPGVVAADGYVVSTRDLRDGYENLQRKAEDVSSLANSCTTTALSVEPSAFGLLAESAAVHAAFRECARSVASKAHGTAGELHRLASTMLVVVQKYEQNDTDASAAVRRSR